MPDKRADKRQRSAGGRRRAATLLVELRWLAGFPDRVDGGWVWRRLDRVAPIALDGDLIARSRRGARTVLREHRAELATLVGDVDRWWAIVDAQLAWCARAIRDGDAGALDLVEQLPVRVARAVRASGSTAAIAAASAWAHEPDTLARVIAWLGTHAGVPAIEPDKRPTLAESPLATTLALARLALDHAAGTEALIALYSVDAPDPQMAFEVVQTTLNRVNGKQVVPKPPKRTRPVVRDWIDRLVEREPAVRQRALALLAAADLGGALAMWADWERANAGRVERANAFAAREDRDRDEAENQARIVVGLQAALDASPAFVRTDELLYDVDLIAGEQGVKAHAAAVRFLAALPASWTAIMRAKLLGHIAAYVAWLEDLRIPWLWDALAEALERGAPEGVLLQWQIGVGKSHRVYIEDDLVEPLKKRADIRRLVGVLVELARRAPVTGDDADHAAAWLAAGLADERVVEVGVALREVSLDGNLTVGIARAAAALAGDSAADLVAQTTALLAAIGDVPRRESEAFTALVEHLVATGLHWLVRAALAAKQDGLLAHVASILALLPKTGRPSLNDQAGETAWIQRYPAELAPALGRLALVDPDAGATAARRLADDLPDPDELRRELAALRARETRSASAEKRIANLERRLADPRMPSAKRLEHLADKLERTACALGLERLVHVVTAAANQRLGRALGLDLGAVLLDDQRADDAASRRTRELLFGLLRLSSHDRALAARMLRARSGPRPWDLRDDPVNRAFLDHLRACGVDPTAWLDDEPHTVIADGKPLALALEGDPLEVFAMGAHFQTCLSPHGGNFFSVIANAADVNKRVLYARRSDGRVVGRCLLAITDANALLAFNPYCHERIDFSSIVRDYALGLAGKLGIPLVPRGTVSNLLSADWYDDGPRDLVGRFGGLDEFRAILPTIDQTDFIARVRTALGRELDDVTLPVVLGMHELDGRPELIVPLVPYLLASTTPSTRLRAAEIAIKHDVALADRLLGEHAASVGLDDHPWTLGHVIAQLRPSLVLARLRATRTVRHLRDDRGDRIAIAGVALAALNRPKQAAALFRLAMERENWLEYEMRTRLAALGMH